MISFATEITGARRHPFGDAQIGVRMVDILLSQIFGDDTQACGHAEQATPVYCLVKHFYKQGIDGQGLSVIAEFDK